MDASFEAALPGQSFLVFRISALSASLSFRGLAKRGRGGREDEEEEEGRREDEEEETDEDDDDDDAEKKRMRTRKTQ